MGNEYQKLLKYCGNRKLRIWHNGGDTKVILRVLSHMHSNEAPDFYHVQDNKVYIIEHFEFDATQTTNRGMKGFARESEIKRNFSNLPYENTGFKTCVEKIDKSISKEWYLENITRVFKGHCDKIPQYKQNLIKEKKASENSDFVVGFFIENEFPPYYNVGDALSLQYALNLLNVKQFLDIFESHKDVYFVLFGGCFDRERQLYYINRDTIPLYREFEIDIKSVCFSCMNDNEKEWRGEFEL